MKDLALVSALHVNEAQILVNRMSRCNRELIELESKAKLVQKDLDDARRELHLLTSGASRKVTISVRSDHAVVKPSKRRGNYARSTKPGELIEAIFKILRKVPQHLDLIVEQVLLILPTTTRSSILECLSRLRRRNQIFGYKGKYRLHY